MRSDPMHPGESSRPHAICGAKTRKGTPCRQWPMTGGDRWRCAVCGKREPWGPGWAWFGSWRQIGPDLLGGDE